VCRVLDSADKCVYSYDIRQQHTSHGNEKMTIQNGKYEAKITVDADGWFVVSFAYNDGEGRAAVPGLKMASYKTQKAAEQAAKRGLAKVA
jgi:hypothetical protein